MSDAARPATDDAPDAESLVADLRDAREDLDAARERVDAVGEAELDALADRYDEATALFDRYEERVTGDGDFRTFIEFQEEVADFTERLPADLRHHDVFEDVDDLLQQRRLTESDWDRVRETLSPVREDVDRLEARADARERYRDARAAVRRRRDDVADRIDDLEALQRLGDADLDAPTERLREPIEAYDDRVTAAFRTFRREAGAREVLDYLAAMAAFPLVPFRTPPEDLHEFVATHDAGTESISQLLEYSEYSQSKLSHYVDDPDALKRTVGTRRTYLQRLDAAPLTVGWPPPDAGTLRYRCRELTSAVARFVDDGGGGSGGSGSGGGGSGRSRAAGEDVLVALRTVRDLPRETDYERLHESAQARAQLGEEERQRLASGAVAAELEASRDAKERLDEALATYQPL